MPSTVTIAQLNRPIVINKYVFAQDDAGGNIKLRVASYNLFASIQQITNTYFLEQLQLKYGEAYKIVIRYEPDRLLTDNDEIVYQNRIFKIKGSRPDDELQKRFIILTASTNNTMANSNDGTVLVPVTEYHYTATGGEYSFQDDVLKDWIGMILVFRDKVNFRVIKTGLPNKDQVLYDANAGTYTFNNTILPLAPNETVDVYKIIQ